MDDVQQPIRIDHGRLIALGRGQFDRKLDEVDVILLRTRPIRTQAPPPVFPRLRRLYGRLAIFVQVDHFQPRSRIPVRRKWHPFAEVRRQPRPRDFSRRRLEPDRPPFSRFIALPFRMVFGIPGRAFFFTHRTFAVPGPIDHGRIIRFKLADLVFRMTGKTASRQLHFDPIINPNDGRIGIPIGFLAVIDQVELLAEPTHGGTDQLVGRHGPGNTPDTIGQFTKRGHDVVLDAGHLQGVVDPPVPPHTGHVMVRHVAMEQEVARQILTEPRAAFGFQIQRFGWPDHFHVHPV